MSSEICDFSGHSQHSVYFLNSYVYYGSSLRQAWLAASQIAYVFFF